MARKDNNLDLKRATAAARIKEIAPYVDALLSMLDETKIDILLIALCGATLKAEDAA